MPLRRRDCLALIAVGLASPTAAAEQSWRGAHAFSFERAEGGTLALADLAQGPLLVVNTATACGFAPQFAGLEQLWLRYGGRGLTVLAVPSNDFGRQEPLPDREIAAAARERFGVTFPIMAAASVSGENAHPFYRWAATERPGETPQWNFHKYLVSREGALLAGFPTTIEPTDPRIIRAIGEVVGPAL